MKPRIEYAEVAPAGMAAMASLEDYVRQTDFDPALLELVKLRASQINGCAYCLDMHTKDARARGESEQRLYAVLVWRETPFFSERERAALAWTEAVTQVSYQHVPDEVYELARQHFSEKELVDLTLAIVAINGWNRLAICFRKVPGSYQPKRQSKGAAKSAHSDGAMGNAASKAAGANTIQGERT
jgi:AhpD family alkylhydroperoxidase